MAHGQNVTELVARCLDGAVLHLHGDEVIEHAAGLVRTLREVRMVASVRLDADAPAALGHAEDERPAVLRVQVGIREHQKALVSAQADVRLEVLKDLACMELLDLGVVTHASRHDLLALELGQILLNMLVAATWLILVTSFGSPVALRLNTHHSHAAEEYLED